MTIKCKIECREKTHSISKDISLELQDSETIKDAASNKIINIVREEYGDVIEQALDYPTVLKTDGRYDPQDISDRLYPGARDYIARNLLGIDVHIKEIEDEEVVTDTLIPLAEILDRIIEERMECESWYCDIAGIVEESLLRFEKEGRWHWGLIADNQVLSDPGLWPSPIKKSNEIVWQKDETIYMPILWFGNSGTPIEPWVICKELSMDSLQFWNETEECYILKAVVEDCDDIFLAWYLTECGRCAPDMDKIKAQCPVSFSNDIEADAFWNSFNDFFINEYMNAQRKSLGNPL